jgi:hypothetical protein
MRDPNKLATFPLDAYKDAPDDQQIFGTGAWSLTVGDVRAAAAARGDVDQDALEGRHDAAPLR